MEAPEKIDFLLQQMRLCLNNHDYVRTELTAEKVSKKLLNLAEHQARKLEYHRLMIRFYEKKGQYLDICKSYRAIFDTESVQQGDWQSALSHAAIFLLLAPFDYEVNDMLQRIKAEKKLIDLPSCLQAYQLLTTNELCAWPLAFEQEWLAHPVFTVQPSGTSIFVSFSYYFLSIIN
jgi:26S proteasome regulatory subunit N5